MVHFHLKTFIFTILLYFFVYLYMCVCKAQFCGNNAGIYFLPTTFGGNFCKLTIFLIKFIIIYIKIIYLCR